MNSRLRKITISIIILILVGISTAFITQNLPYGRVYYSKQAGNWDIYYQDGNEEPVQLTHHSSQEVFFDLSPDGQEIVYGRNGIGIMIMDSEKGDTTSRAIQTDTYVAQPRFSPDGQDIAFRKGSSVSGDIYIISKTATPNDQPFRLTSDCGAEDNPNWSPDGTMLVYADSLEGDCSHSAWQYLTIINRDGSNRRLILDQETELPIQSGGNNSHIWKYESGMHRILILQQKWPSPCCHHSFKIANFSLPADPLSSDPIYASVDTIFVSEPPSLGIFLGDWDNEGKIWFTWLGSGLTSRICVIENEDPYTLVCEPEPGSRCLNGAILGAGQGSRLRGCQVRCAGRRWSVPCR